MDQSTDYSARLSFLAQQVREQEMIFRQRKEQLEAAQSEALQRQFALTDLNNAGFFLRRFGNLPKKKQEAWSAYQQAVLALEQAKYDFSQQEAQLARLQAEYQALLSEK